jgi:hypothetical protein
LQVATPQHKAEEQMVCVINVIVVNAYRPGDIILIAMKPSSIRIGRQDFVKNIFPF